MARRPCLPLRWHFLGSPQGPVTPAFYLGRQKVSSVSSFGAFTINRALPKLSNCLIIQVNLNVITSEGLPTPLPHASLSELLTDTANTITTVYFIAFLNV